MREYSGEEIDAWIAERTERMPDFAYFGGEDLNYNGRFISVHRDSYCLDRSNWRRIKEDAEEAFPDAFWTMPCSHWAVGWIDHLMVDVTNREAVAWCMNVCDDLQDYPIYDEDDWSSLEHDEEWECFCNNAVPDISKNLEKRQFELEGYIEEGELLTEAEDALLAAIRWFDDLSKEDTEQHLSRALSDLHDRGYFGSGDDFWVDADKPEVMEAVETHIVAAWRGTLTEELHDAGQLELPL